MFPFVDPTLAVRLELAHAWRGIHYARAQQALHPERTIRIEPVADGYAIYAGPNSPLNRVIGLGCTGPVTAADLAQIEALYTKAGSPVCLDLCPLADETLLTLLQSRDYRMAGFQSVLALALTEPLPQVAAPTELRVTQATPQEAALWIQTTAQGFGGTESPAPELFDVLAPNFHAAQAYCYFAWLGNEPVAGGAMYYHEDVVELGGASTRPAFRRHGAQTALIRQRLLTARALGCDFALVITEPGSDSQRNLMRKGFHLAYTKATLVKA
ncbi:MAG: GNAT family N-acetyltransferase [Caldilinea sp. CFX5]|nr:GNAT family N-acetyltransferase [Caldilinea sp. CFX5]